MNRWLIMVALVTIGVGAGGCGGSESGNDGTGGSGSNVGADASGGNGGSTGMDDTGGSWSSDDAGGGWGGADASVDVGSDPNWSGADAGGPEDDAGGQYQRQLRRGAGLRVLPRAAG